MLDFYVLQDKNYGLGNFINLTPTIRSIAELKGEPVPVYFDIDHVKQCFIDCPFITILDEMPYSRPLFTSGLIAVRNNLPDYINAYVELSKTFDLSPEIPHTYVDEAKEVKPMDGKYTLLMCGSGSEDPMYLSKNQPNKEDYAPYLYLDDCLFTGSVKDFNRHNWFNHLPHYLNDIRKSLALIRDAEYIISNDTGLAHAAGAMNKNITILWRFTMLPKSGNPGKNTLIKLCK